MDEYVIFCNCSDDWAKVGYITDNRANGGPLRIVPPPSSLGDSVRAEPTARGDRRSRRRIECPLCGLNVELVESTAAELVDVISRRPPGEPHSPRDRWGKTAVPFTEYVDLSARSEEFLLELQGDRDQESPSEVPTVTRYALVYVIPLTELCRYISQLRGRGV